MEIGISKRGELRILTLKGNLRLQHWRVIGKHLDLLLAQGARWVALDLSGANLIDEAGMACLRIEARKFRGRDANLLLIVSPSALESLQASNSVADLGEDRVFADWGGLEGSLRSRGPALSGA